MAANKRPGSADSTPQITQKMPSTRRPFVKGTTTPVAPLASKQGAGQAVSAAILTHDQYAATTPIA